MARSSRMKKEIRAAGAELIATALFVFFGAGSVSGMVEAGATGPINYAFSFGAAITTLAFGIASISGGHMNPAVTLSMMLTRNVSVTRGVFYLVAQFVGAIIGGAILKQTVGGVHELESGGRVSHYNGGIGLAKGTSAVGGMGLEFMGTFLLLFTVFNVAVWAAKPLENDLSGSTVQALAPIPIGFAVGVAHLTLGPFTGCGINPARVVGAVIFDDEFKSGNSETPQGRAYENFWIYFIGPLLAVVAAPLTYRFLHGTFKPGSAQSNLEDDAARPTKMAIQPLEDATALN